MREPTRAPSIVLIYADDLGWGDIGCLNPDSKIPTPHIDALAARGMSFTDAHAPGSVCSASRYGIMTGRYSWRTDVKAGIIYGDHQPWIEPGRMTLASLLKSIGWSRIFWTQTPVACCRATPHSSYVAQAWCCWWIPALAMIKTAPPPKPGIS